MNNLELKAPKGWEIDRLGLPTEDDFVLSIVGGRPAAVPCIRRSLTVQVVLRRVEFKPCPEKGNFYYIQDGRRVRSAAFYSFISNKQELIDAGNFFETRELAERALAKVKNLLNKQPHGVHE